MDECTHGLVGCATCAGTDTLLDWESRGHDGQGLISRALHWSDADTAVARRMDLTTAEVADLVGRPVNQVSAHRINRLGMSGWKGYVSKPRP